MNCLVVQLCCSLATRCAVLTERTGTTRVGLCHHFHRPALPVIIIKREVHLEQISQVATENGSLRNGSVF